MCIGESKKTVDCPPEAPNHHLTQDSVFVLQVGLLEGGISPTYSREYRTGPPQEPEIHGG